MLSKNLSLILIFVISLFNIQISSANPVDSQTTTKAPPEIKFMMDVMGCVYNEMLIMKKEGKSDQEIIDYQMNKEKMDILNLKCVCQLKDKLPPGLNPTPGLKEIVKKCP